MAVASLGAEQGLRRGLGRLGWGVVLMVAPVLAWADPGASAPLPDVAAWIAKTRSVAVARNFEGMLTYTAAGVVSSSRLAHYVEGKDRYERLEVLDGPARLRYGHNDRTLTVWPASRVAMVEDASGPRGFPRLPAGGERAADFYKLSRLAPERLAGHAAEVHLLTPLDDLRFRQRLWTERESGLMIREDVLDRSGQVLESTAFSELQLLVKPGAQAVVKAMARLDGLRLVPAGAQLTQLTAEGWRLAQPVPGFELVHCSKRALNVGAEGPQVQVLRSVFSDGVAQVSVFIEPFDPARHKQPLRTVLGATHTSAMQRGAWWFTTVGEVPMKTVALFEQALEREPSR